MTAIAFGLAATISAWCFGWCLEREGMRGAWSYGLCALASVTALIIDGALK